MPARAERELLRSAFDAAVGAVHPRQCVPPHVPAPPAHGRTIVVGAGKASVAMAEALAAHYAAPLEGVVVTRRGTAQTASIRGIDILEAAHPVPDETSLAASRRVLGQLQAAGSSDRVMALLSGGGSALLACPEEGLTLADEQDVTRQLLASGAGIGAINCVRKKLSRVKGGRLARMTRAADIRVLAISDVPGDDVADVASGPFSADPTTLAEARSVLARFGCRVPAAVERFLADPARETPKPGDPAFARVTSTTCARSADAIAAAARVLAASGFEPLLLDDRIDEPAHDLAARHAALARELVAAGRRAALVTGGETTVTVRNPDGRGGRNTEYLLALGLALGADGAWALACDTDGIDGTGGHAGAVLSPDSLRRAALAGVDAERALAANCSRDFFAALGDLVLTGPTGTNANDVRIVLVG